MSNPNTAVFPGALPDNIVLPVADDTYFATLSGNINNSVTSSFSFSLSITNLPSIVVIDNEIILVKTMSGSTVLTSVRGFGGSTATSHTAGSFVFGYIVSYHNNQIIAELVSICTSLGINLGNVILSGQSAGGDLTGTYPNPTIATVGGLSAGSVASGATNGQFAYAGKSAVYTVPFSATPVFALASGSIQFLTLTGNVTSSTVTGLSAGQKVIFAIVEDGPGGHSFVWPANVFGAMSITTTTNAKNSQEFYSYDGTNLISVAAGTVN